MPITSRDLYMIESLTRINHERVLLEIMNSDWNETSEYALGDIRATIIQYKAYLNKARIAGDRLHSILQEEIPNEDH